MRSRFAPRSIGLVLGSGAARGIAHIGVLKVLDREGLAPSVVTGTSMGALVGALYASGMTPAQIERIALTFDVKTIAGPGDVAITRGAVLSGAKVEAFLRQHLPADFADLRIPFGCVATDLTRNRPVRFTEGDLIAAIRASVSVPIAFLPVRMDDMLLVDGYVCEPMPISLARHLGGETIVAVDVSGAGTVSLSAYESASEMRQVLEMRSALRSGVSRERGSTALDMLGAVSEAFEGRLVASSLPDADVVVSPEVRDMTGFQFQAAASAIAAGEAAALAAVERIRRRARRHALER